MVAYYYSLGCVYHAFILFGLKTYSVRGCIPCSSFFWCDINIRTQPSTYRWHSRLWLFNEFLGSDGVFFDSDNDGDLDIYLVDGTDQVGVEPERSTSNTLYRNDGDGAFFLTLQTPWMLEMQVMELRCTVGDYDNDGHLDLYITNFGPNTWCQDNGDGSFTDVSTRSSLANKRWRTSCALANIDTMLNIISSRTGMWKRGPWVYCGPCSYPPDADVCYRNNGEMVLSPIYRPKVEF